MLSFTLSITAIRAICVLPRLDWIVWVGVWCFLHLAEISMHHCSKTGPAFRDVDPFERAAQRLRSCRPTESFHARFVGDGKPLCYVYHIRTLFRQRCDVVGVDVSSYNSIFRAAAPSVNVCLLSGRSSNSSNSRCNLLPRRFSDNIQNGRISAAGVFLFNTIN